MSKYKKNLNLNLNTLVKNPLKLQFWRRDFIIPSTLLNKKVLIYNGYSFKTIFIKKEHIGFKIGEFALTRKNRFQIIKKKKNKK